MKIIKAIFLSCTIIPWAIASYYEKNCYTCYSKNTYSFCQYNSTTGVCCEQDSLSSECSSSKYLCSNQAASFYARPAYCLNIDQIKCGGELTLSPSYTIQNITVPTGALTYSNGQSCVWTVKGDNTDFNSGIQIQLYSMSNLNVYVLYGSQLTKANAKYLNASISTGKMNFSMYNSTYIIAAPINGKTGSLKFGYQIVPNMYNLTYLMSQGYIQQFYAAATTDNESARVILIACVVGGVILLLIIIFMTLVYATRCFKNLRKKNLEYKQYYKANLEESQKEIQMVEIHIEELNEQPDDTKNQTTTQKNKATKGAKRNQGQKHARTMTRLKTTTNNKNGGADAIGGEDLTETQNVKVRKIRRKLRKTQTPNHKKEIQEQEEEKEKTDW